MNMDPTEAFIAWNGIPQPAASLSIPPTSEAWLYGYGCFETMSLAGGRVRFLEDHWARLTSSAKEMGLRISFSQSDTEKTIEALRVRNQCPDGTARLSLHANGTETNWMLRVFPPPANRPPCLRVGISRFPHPGPSPLSRWKHNNYLLNLLAFREAQREGLHEVILCRGEEMIEGARSNLWIWTNQELLTPPLTSGALPGVIRGRILRHAEKCGIRAREQVLRLEDLRRAEGLFFSNSGMILTPAIQCGPNTYPPHTERVTLLVNSL